MTSTDDLVKFLRARLDDEAMHAEKDLHVADHATPGRWQARYGVNLAHSWIETDSTPVARLDSSHHEADCMHIARFRPDTIRERARRRLADVEAKRRLVDELHNLLLVGAAYPDEAGPEVAEQCLRLLAQPDAGHPDYQQEWKP